MSFNGNSREEFKRRSKRSFKDAIYELKNNNSRLGGSITRGNDVLVREQCELDVK